MINKIKTKIVNYFTKSLQEEIENLKEVVGEKKIGSNYPFSLTKYLWEFDCYDEYSKNDQKKEPTLFERIDALEKYLNVKFTEEKTTKEFKGYKLIKKEKTKKKK